MGDDILKSINKIKISVNENDQVLWECQAAAKSYNDATTKLKEECDRLNKDIVEIDEQTKEIEPQIKIVSKSYELQTESIPLMQQSLINQRLYKNYLQEKIKKHEEESKKITNEYIQHIQSVKENLELTNPTYKLLQDKRTELKQRKIRCMICKHEITELKDTNRRKREMKWTIFRSEVVEFARNWVARKKYLEAVKQLEEETRKERELMQKLAEVTEMLKRKELEMCSKKQTSNFNVPQIEFHGEKVNATDGERLIKKVDKKQDDIDDFKTMLKEKDSELAASKLPDNRRLKFNTTKSKLIILDNVLVKPSKQATNVKSREERRKEIEAKIKIAVEKCNRSISRQNSKKSVVLSQKSFQINKKPGKPLEELNPQSQAENKEKRTDQNLQKTETTRPTIQILNVTTIGPKKLEAKLPSQPNSQTFNKENAGAGVGAGTMSFQMFSQDTKCSQDGNFPSQPSSSGIRKHSQKDDGKGKNLEPVSDNLGSKIEGKVTGDQPIFMSTSGFPNPFLSVQNKFETFLNATEKPKEDDNLSQFKNTSMQMTGFPFMTDHSMIMSDDEDAVMFKSPEFDPNFAAKEDEGNKGATINFSGVPNFTGQPVFSFTQTNNPFTFK